MTSRRQTLAGSKSVKSKIVLRSCLGMRKGDSVLIAFDDEGRFNSESVFEASLKLGLNPTRFHITADDKNERPVRELAELMKANDATIFCLNQRRIVTYAHSDARINAIKTGKKIGFLTQKIRETPSASELKRIHVKSLRLGRLLEKSHKITILSGSKHQWKLEFSVNGRKSFPLSSILTREGDWGAIPDYAEAAIAPIEDSSIGRIEIDGMIMGYGVLKGPIILDFQDGKIAKFAGVDFRDQLRSILRSSDESVRVMCELGLGANHLRTRLRGEFDDKKMLGSAHIALGDNHTIGGCNVSRQHIDFLVKRPKIEFDGMFRDLYRV